MSKLRLLIGVQLRNAFLATNAKRKGKIGSILLTGVLMAALSIYYSFLFLAQSSPQEVSTTMILLGVALVAVFAISNSQGMLFGYKDSDLLRSMPFEDRDLVASKLIVFLILQYFYAALFILPGCIVVGLKGGATALYYVNLFLGFLGCPMVPMLIASLIGVFLQKLSAGRKHGELIKNLGNVAVVFLIWGFSVFSSLNGESHALTSVLQYLPQIRWFTESLWNGNVGMVLLSLVVNGLALVLFIYIMGGFIVRLDATLNQSFHVKNFKVKQSRTKTPIKALLCRERDRYFSNFGYVFNTFFGMILMLGLAVYLVIQKPVVLSLMDQAMPQAVAMRSEVAQLAVVAIAFFGQTSCMTSSSISLEGKSLWILKTLPISDWSVLSSKILFNVQLILVPQIPTLLLLAVAFELPLVQVLLGSVFLIVAAFFVSMFGLMCNLKFPKFDYVSEIAVIKQSLSAFLGVMIPMMIGMFLCGLVLSEPSLYYLVFALYAVGDLVLFAVLKGWGVRRYQSF